MWLIVEIKKKCGKLQAFAYVQSVGELKRFVKTFCVQSACPKTINVSSVSKIGHWPIWQMILKFE